MDRRSFLKALGTTLASCSVASVAEAANSLMGDVFRRETKARMPSMKVIGMGRSGLALMQAVEEAFGDRYRWFDSYGKTVAAASGVVIVSGHPKLLDTRLNEVQAELARIEPLKIPHWGGKPNMLLLAAPDDRREDDGYFCVDIISTGIEFVGES